MNQKNPEKGSPVRSFSKLASPRGADEYTKGWSNLEMNWIARLKCMCRTDKWTGLWRTRDNSIPTHPKLISETLKCAWSVSTPRHRSALSVFDTNREHRLEALESILLSIWRHKVCPRLLGRVSACRNNGFGLVDFQSKTLRRGKRSQQSIKRRKNLLFVLPGLSFHSIHVRFEPAFGTCSEHHWNRNPSMPK